MRIILLEVLIVSFSAGILGYAVGTIGAHIVIPFVTGSSFHIMLDPLLGICAVLLSVTIGLLASAYPSFAASRMDPNEALRVL